MQATRFHEIQDSLISHLQLDALLEHLTQLVFLGQNGSSAEQAKKNLILNLFAGRERLANVISRDPEFKAIADSSGLYPFYEVSEITAVVVGVQAGENFAQLRSNLPIYNRLVFMRANVSAFLRQAAALKEYVIVPREHISPSDKSNSTEEASNETVQFEVFDIEIGGFDPDRIAEILDLIEDLFDAVARSYGIHNFKIKVAYFDSGSGLIMGFRSAAVLVGAVRKFLTELLPILRDWKSDQHKEKIAAAKDTLSLCKQIAEMREQGMIDHQEAAQLQHTAIDAASKLIAKGAYLRSLPIETVDYRKVLHEAVEVKQLAAPNLPLAATKPDATPPIGGQN